MTRRRHSESATEPCPDSEPRPQTALWPIMTVAVPVVLLYVAVGFTVEVLFGIRLRRNDDSDGPDPPG